MNIEDIKNLLSIWNELLGAFVIFGSCAWICYAFNRTKVNLWISVVCTLGVVTISAIAALNGKLNSVLEFNLVLVGLGLVVGLVYQLKRRYFPKKTLWKRDD